MAGVLDLIAQDLARNGVSRGRKLDPSGRPVDTETGEGSRVSRFDPVCAGGGLAIDARLVPAMLRMREKAKQVLLIRGAFEQATQGGGADVTSATEGEREVRDVGKAEAAGREFPIEKLV